MSVEFNAHNVEGNLVKKQLYVIFLSVNRKNKKKKKSFMRVERSQHTIFRSQIDQSYLKLSLIYIV